MSGTNGGEGQVPASEGPGSHERAGPPGEGAGRAGTPAEGAEPRDRPRRDRRRRFSWRTPLAALLIIIGCVLAPVSVLTLAA